MRDQCKESSNANNFVDFIESLSLSLFRISVHFRYTGYCSQYPFVCGDTYARATHKLLLDPTISSTKTLILSDNTVIADCEVNDW